MSKSNSTGNSRFNGLLIGLLAFLVTGILIGLRQNVIPNDVVSRQLSPQNVIHLSGTISHLDIDDEFEIWYDHEESTFRAINGIGTSDVIEKVYKDGSIKLHTVGDNALDTSVVSEFNSAVLETMPDFAYALNPDVRSGFTNLGAVTIGSETYLGVRDPLDRTLLLSPTSYLPQRLRFRGYESIVTYTEVEQLTPTEVPASAFLISTPIAGSVTSSGFQYLFSETSEFNQIYDFTAYDAYWLGSSFEDWDCYFVTRNETDGPLEQARATLESQPGKHSDSVEFVYIRPNETGQDQLDVTTIPHSALIYQVEDDPLATPVSVGGESGYYISHGEATVLYFTIADSQVKIVANSDTEVDLMEIADQLIRIQDSTPVPPVPSPTPTATTTPTRTPTSTPCSVLPCP